MAWTPERLLLYTRCTSYVLAFEDPDLGVWKKLFEFVQLAYLRKNFNYNLDFD